jgi:hypothetical protein
VGREYNGGIVVVDGPDGSPAGRISATSGDLRCNSLATSLHCGRYRVVPGLQTDSCSRSCTVSLNGLGLPRHRPVGFV